MLDFSSIASLKAARDAVRDGLLLKVLLLPTELGGQDVPENVVYIPRHAWEIKASSNAELFQAVSNGMNEVEILPEYRGASLVPTTITITAAPPGLPPQYKLAIGVW